MMAAMVSVLWAYDGWTNVTPLAEEIRDPGRNVPRALIWGMAVLIAVYLAMTLAYHYVLPMDEIASPAAVARTFGTQSPPSIATTSWAGPGVVGVSILVMCSTFISLNGNALTGPRAYFAMARDGLFPAGLCRVHRRFQTPANAVLAQGIWAIILTVAGTFLIVVPPDGRAGLAWTDPGRLEEAQRDAALRPALHLRHLRGEPFLHAGDLQRVRAAHPPARPAAPLSHLGLSVHPPALRGRGASAPGKHARRPSEPGAVARGTRHHPARRCRPTGCFGANPADVT